MRSRGLYWLTLSMHHVRKASCCQPRLKLCPDGGTGRRAGLKIRFSQESGSSTLPLGTKRGVDKTGAMKTPLTGSCGWPNFLSYFGNEHSCCLVICVFVPWG